MKAYLSTFMLRLKLETQYRAAALGGLVTQVFFGLILVYLYRTLYGTGADAKTLRDIATYVWIQQAFFRMLLSTDGTLTEAILRGDMAYLLVRPIDQYAYWFMRALAQKAMGALLRCAPLLLVAALLPAGVGISLPASLPALLVCLLSLLLGLLTVCAVDTLSSGIILRTLDNRGVTSVISSLKMFLAGNILPLTLFPDAWQRALAFSPFSQIMDTPIRLYTGQYALAQAPALLALQCAWIALLILIGWAVWHKNLTRIVVQGG